MKKIKIFLLIFSLLPGIFAGAFFANYLFKPDVIEAVNLLIKDTDFSEHGVISGSKKSGSYTWSAGKATVDDLGGILWIALVALFVPSIVTLVVLGLGFQFSRFLFNIFSIDEKDYFAALIIINFAGLFIGVTGRISFQFFAKYIIS